MNRVKLPEICTIPITDGTHQTPTYTTKEDGIPFISSKDVTTKKIDWTNIKYITKDLHEQLYKRIAPQKNDILLAKNGTTGVAALVEDNRVFDIYVTLAVIRPDLEKVFPKYLLHVINSDYCKKQFSSHLVGIGVPNLHLKDINQTSIPLPSLPEQQKIAAHLDSIQSAIDNKKQQLQQLDELVKSKFVEMFHDKGFSKKKIGEIISISRGASPRPISAFVTNDLDGINWIKIGDVSEDSLYIEKTSERITKEGADKSRYVKPGDFILSNSMSFGRPYILKIYGCVHDGWLILSNYENTFNPLFLYYELRDDEVQSQFDGSANGATVRNLNSDIVKSIDVVVPPIELQNTFAEYVQKIDSAKAIIKTQLVDLQELLDSKMDEYFGE